CNDCGRRYDRVDGVPVFADVHGEVGGDEYKRGQASFFDEQPEDWETRRPAGAPPLYEWLMGEKFRRSLRGLESMFPGATALTVCGGSGMDAEFLARAGARVIASDISIGATLRTRRRAELHGVDIVPIVADAERLPFRSASVDVVY